MNTFYILGRNYRGVVMGISGIILITFLLAIVLLVAGFITKSRVLKIISIAAFVISIGLFLLVWNALSYM